jgi:WD repeat and SOF domain-containing protein 1
MHPFARARERIRAVNAVKMERMFAKPFVASLEGHVDAVEVLVRQPNSLSMIASGSWDGGEYVHGFSFRNLSLTLTTEIITHNIAQQQIATRFSAAHKGKVTGLTWAEGDRLVSCGVDRTIKLWDTRRRDAADENDEDAGASAVSSCDFILSWHLSTLVAETFERLPRKSCLQVSKTII